MLYPKNTSDTLNENLFKNPTSEYRGAPFWAWNCELQEEELLRQLDDTLEDTPKRKKFFDTIKDLFD